MLEGFLCVVVGVALAILILKVRNDSLSAFEKQRRRARALDELKKTLETGSARKIDDWVVIYGDDVSYDVVKHARARRDELISRDNH